jgi:PAS domain S-box-containing protein
MPSSKPSGAPDEGGRLGSELPRLLLDRVPAMLAYWDASLRCRFANLAYERWFGVSAESLIGKHLSELLGPLYRLNLPYLEKALRGEPQEFEREFPDPFGGSARDSLVHYIPDVVEGVVRGIFVLVSDISDIKRFTRALEESEARFSGIVASSPDAIVSIDERQRVVLFNEGAEAIFGWKREEILGKPLDVLVPGRFRAGHRDHLRQFANSGARSRRVPDRPVVVGLRKSGEEFPAEASLSKLGSGDTGLLTASLRDISERLRIDDERKELLARERRAREEAEAASERVRESEERFRLAIDEAPIGMALVALDGHFVRVNHVLCEIVGYTADELSGLTFQRITHPEDVDKDVGSAGALARGEIPRYQLEKRYVRKDGGEVDVMLSASVLRGGDGVARYYIAQIEDISERKRLENDQKRAEVEQRLLAEVGPVLAGSFDYEETLPKVAELAARDLADVCIVDIIEDGHERRLKVASRDPSQARLCEWLALLPLDPGRRDPIRTVFETKAPVLLPRMAAEAIASLGRSTDAQAAALAAGLHSMVAVPLVGQQRVLGVIALISSRPARTYGPADVRFAEELARRAALSIEAGRLYRAARRATQVRDDLLGIVAHDLRNPLNAILMAAGLLRPRGSPERRSQRPRETIERSARRMNRLIEDLLDVTRLEAGRLSVEPRGVAADLIVTDAVDAQRPLAASTGLELNADLPSRLSPVWADRDRLLQVFENLVGNAIKFTPPNGRVTVGAEQGDGEVVFRISDTGAGIAADDMPHLFERFWQGGRATRRGAGLGLPIVKGIVDAHGGRIWVTSAPGRGSTFSFAIPAVSRAQAWTLPTAMRGP